MRARVLAESGNFNHPGSTAFCFDGRTDTEFFIIGIKTDRVVDNSGTLLATIDDTQFHDYRTEVTPGQGYDLFIDDVKVASGPPRFLSVSNSILFGDCTGAAGTLAEMTAFTFSQKVSPREDRVTICHKGKTTTVAESALPAHLAHGDTEGPWNS